MSINTALPPILITAVPLGLVNFMWRIARFCPLSLLEGELLLSEFEFVPLELDSDLKPILFLSPLFFHQSLALQSSLKHCRLQFGPANWTTESRDI